MQQYYIRLTITFVFHRSRFTRSKTNAKAIPFWKRLTPIWPDDLYPSTTYLQALVITNEIECLPSAVTVLFLTISLLLATRMTAVSRFRSLLRDESFVSACWKDLLSATEYSTRYASTSGMMGGAPDSTSASLGCNQQVHMINFVLDDYILEALDIDDISTLLRFLRTFVYVLQGKKLTFLFTRL